MNVGVSTVFVTISEIPCVIEPCCKVLSSVYETMLHASAICLLFITYAII